MDLPVEREIVNLTSTQCNPHELSDSPGDFVSKRRRICPDVLCRCRRYHFAHDMASLLL